MLISPASEAVTIAQPKWVERAGFTTTLRTMLAFVPQLQRVMKMCSDRNVSLGTMVLFFSTVSMRLANGMSAGSRLIIDANAITLVLSFSILSLKLKYSRHATKEFGL